MSDKLLAEFCGVCWHDLGDGASGPGYLECKKCEVRFGLNDSPFPDFTTPDGMHLLYQAMERKGKWARFCWHLGALKCGGLGESVSIEDFALASGKADQEFHRDLDLTKKRDLLAQFIKEVNDVK